MSPAHKESDRALIVVDMVVDFVSAHGVRAIPQAPGLIRYVQGELRYFRERGRPVVFACTVPKHPAGDDAADMKPQVIQELTPRTGEKVLVKRAYSAFFETGLAELLGPGVRRLTLVGVETHTSILLTAADARARGYEVVVPDPCVCARDEDDHRFALRQIREIWPHDDAAWATPPAASAADAEPDATTGTAPTPES